ncbi:Bouquet formation protein 4 [Colletotrichum tanaceti]|uniref:Bouquet formation protein 4 n=1 Tax=Colletotrichum tanaceti TaxID=1306861 RepID=A0A4U6X449_9PEZI|nr:Bouquet formation protein 4 [Colletotrichum tanaceti]KAJ0165196.1 Bouquet formation protein 4 [Colletotrichum tanaceti]TKW50142.1 Bouquet formation protein 4 [Colletotrichum tanaceti]
MGATLRVHKVKKYADLNVAEPAEGTPAHTSWEAGRDVAYYLLVSSCDTLIDKLLDAGWQDDGNPYTLMKALEKYISKASEDPVGALVDEFAKGNAHDHKTLHDALKRAQYLRARITNICGENSDHFWAVLLLNYFKVRLPDTFRQYTNNDNNNSKKPAWSDVVETIYTLSPNEKEKIAYRPCLIPRAYANNIPDHFFLRHSPPERRLPAKRNPMMLEDAPSHANLVLRRSLTQTQLLSNPPKGQGGVFEYSHFRTPLSKCVVSGVFKSSPVFYFLLRRSLDDFVSATGIFKATFPYAMASEEEAESNHIKSFATTCPEETAYDVWIPPDHALALAKEYGIAP